MAAVMVAPRSERFLRCMPLSRTGRIGPVEDHTISHALFPRPRMYGRLWRESPSSHCCLLAFSQDACLCADLLHPEGWRSIRHMPPSTRWGWR